MTAVGVCRAWSFVLLPVIAGTSAASGTEFSHDDWTLVLERFVDDNGLVDYEGLARNRDIFDRYVAAIETTGPASAPDLFPDRYAELAHYINAYNALVFKGVLGRGPESQSVWRGLISGYSFFVGMDVTIDGVRTHLKKLEDSTIREKFRDPRIHAALNCASMGCPRLPQHAFDPDNLDEQLDAAMGEFVNDERHVEVDDDRRVVRMSKIFDWFSEDFIGYESRAGSSEPGLIDYINRYRPSGSRIPAGYRIKFLPYDKSINHQP